MRKLSRPVLRLVTGFVGQDWPSNGDTLVQRILCWSGLSSDARLVLRGLIEEHSMDHHRKPDRRDVYMDTRLEFVAMFAHMESLEKVRAALRELDQAGLVRVEHLDPIRSDDERLRVRFDYRAIADLVGLVAKQHNAPCTPGLAKARGPDGREDPPFQPLTGSSK